MATQLYNLPAGSTSTVFAVNSNQSIFACPQVQGGTVLLEYATNVSGPWFQWIYGASSSGQSFRIPTGTTGYIRVTPTSQPATLAISDMTPYVPGTVLVSINAPCASPNTTSEVIIGSFRIPPYTLPLSFNLKLFISCDFTNNTNSKTLTVRVNGLTGTSIFTSSSLASTLNINTFATVSGMGDGVSWKGFGAGANNAGFGTSTTAFATLTRDYISQETEIVVTATKATGSDAFTMQQLTVVAS